MLGVKKYGVITRLVGKTTSRTQGKAFFNLFGTLVVDIYLKNTFQL